MRSTLCLLVAAPLALLFAHPALARPATPPGLYPLTVGVYNADTGERLEAGDEQGQPLGSVIELTHITVE